MKIKRIITILFLVIICDVNANAINKIKMNIHIDKNGDANIVETWDVNINNGTEGFKPYYNLGKSEIKDFKVSLNDQLFSYSNNWKSKNTLDDKAYENSIINILDGKELVWGLSDYGRNTYLLQYTITNFIAKTNDADMIYWTLIPHDINQTVRNVKITITADHYIENTVDVWGYGNYGGLSYVADGKIEMEKTNLTKDEYMTILVKFDQDTFYNSNYLNNDFDYYLDMSKEGSVEYKESTIQQKVITTLFMLLQASIILGSMYFLIKQQYSKMPFRTKKKKSFKNINYFREIPFGDDLLKANFVAQGYSLSTVDTRIIGALMLKFINVGLIEMHPGRKKELIVHDDYVHTLSDNEQELYNMIRDASKNNILKQRDFNKYADKNYQQVRDWFEKIINDERIKLAEQGLLIKQKHHYRDTERLFNEGEKLAGLKKFLKELSSIKDKRTIEVKLWEEYLMYAQIFGIAKQVSKELRHLYPEVITEEISSSYILVDSMSRSYTRSANTAYQRAQNYSSGGGGFSSGGGGGGSFGGGGGGGGFR